MRDFKQLSPDLRRKAQCIQRLVEHQLPVLLGGSAIAFAVRNFEHQGFQGTSFEPWPPRKITDRRGRDLTRYRRGRRAGKLSKFGRSQKGRALLVKSGALRGGFHYRVGPARVSIYNYQPYAVAHNRGLGALPQRKMIGRSPLLERQLRALLRAQVTKIFKK